jgi:hypothetical protein
MNQEERRKPMDTSALVPCGGTPAQDTMDSKVVVSSVFGKLGYIAQERAEQLQRRDWQRDAIRFLKASIGFLVALVLGFVYYVAFFPIVSERIGCKCSWDPIIQALTIGAGIFLLALWPTLKFSRL